MEMVKTDNFTEMSVCEMQRIDGGSVWLAIGVGVVIFVSGLTYVKHKYF